MTNTIIGGAGADTLTNEQCTPYTVHYAYDTTALANGTGSAVTKQGGKTWYFLTADYAFGKALEKATSDVVKANGGQVLGAVRAPLSASDFSSFLLQAQASKAQILGLANAGGDTVNSIKAAKEFGITKTMKLAALLMFITDVHGMGLQAAQGLYLTESYYWDRNDASREFGNRFKERTGRMPNMVQAGTYSGVMHYLKAIKEAGTDETEAVAAKMREMPVSDFFAENGKVLANGRMVSDVYLFQVKKPEESKGEWDYYNLIATIPGEEAYMKAEDSGCALVK